MLARSTAAASDVISMRGGPVEERERGARRLGDVGGTPGGLGLFAIGFAMLVLGGYWLLTQVAVIGSRGLYFPFFGYGGFGLSLVPLLFGVALLFFNGRNPLAWLLIAAGALLIVGAILADLQIYFLPTSLFNTLVMLCLLVGGLALVARSLFPLRSNTEARRGGDVPRGPATPARQG
jgi:hypothetical protein